MFIHKDVESASINFDHTSFDYQSHAINISEVLLVKSPRQVLSGEASGYPWPRSASLHLERPSEERTEPSKRELPLASAEFSPAVRSFSN